MQIRRQIIIKIDLSKMQGTKIFIPEDVDEHDIGMTGDDHLYADSSFPRINQCFSQEITGKEIGGLDNHLFIRILDKLNEFLADPFFGNGWNIPDNLIIAMPDKADIGILLKNIFVENPEIKIKNLFKGNCNIAFDTKHHLAPFETVFIDIRGPDEGNAIVDDHDLPVITAVIFSKEIDKEFDLGKKPNFSTILNKFRKISVRNGRSPGIDQDTCKFQGRCTFLHWLCPEASPHSIAWGRRKDCRTVILYETLLNYLTLKDKNS
jgi:hypothetical protein